MVPSKLIRMDSLVDSDGFGWNASEDARSCEGDALGEHVLGRGGPRPRNPSEALAVPCALRFFREPYEPPLETPFDRDSLRGSAWGSQQCVVCLGKNMVGFKGKPKGNRCHFGSPPKTDTQTVSSNSRASVWLPAKIGLHFVFQPP